MLAIPKGRKPKRMDRSAEDSFAVQKERPVRCKAYTDHLKTLPCRVCGSPGADPAHLGHSATGFKSSDAATVPLCRFHHNDFDTCPEGKERWWMRHVAIPEAQAEYRKWEIMQ